MDATFEEKSKIYQSLIQDEDFIRAYEAREMAMHDWTTGVNTAIEKREIEFAKKLILRKRPIEEIIEDTGLDVETVNSIIKGIL